MEYQGSLQSAAGEPRSAASAPNRPELVSVGVDFRTADVDQREELQRRWPSLEKDLCAPDEHGRRGWRVREHIVLTTCNRFELYAAVDGGVDDMQTWLEASWLAGVPASGATRSPGRIRRGPDIARHLLRVAAGLESMVLGESEILGQVRRALADAEDAGACGPVLRTLFETAILTGRRARNETPIGRRRSTVSSLAIGRVEDLLGDLGRQRALVIGVGEIGRRICKVLASRGNRELGVVNRTPSRARPVAERYGARTWELSELETALTWADVAFTCTASSTPIVEAATISRVARCRGSRPLLLVDLSVPRNVEPSAAGTEAVTLLGLADLSAEAEEALATRRSAIPMVEAVVSEELANWSRELRRSEVEPLIRDLRRQADTIRATELERVQRLLGPLDPEVWSTIQGFSRSLVNKLLHEPTERLRTSAERGELKSRPEALRELFDLPRGQDVTNTVELGAGDVLSAAVDEPAGDSARPQLVGRVK